ncbi:hypothetical protein D3C85_1616540 [compost metagenome]
MPGEAEAAVQFVEDRLRVLAEGREHDQGMEPQVGGFVDQIAAVAAVGGVLGGEDGFHRFLADLLEDLVEPLVVQAGHVGAVRRGALAGLEDCGEAGEGVVAAVLTHGCGPCARRWRADP